MQLRFSKDLLVDSLYKKNSLPSGDISTYLKIASPLYFTFQLDLSE